MTLEPGAMLLLLLSLLIACSVARPQQPLFYYPPAQPGSFYYMPQAALPSYQPVSAVGGGAPGQYVLLYPDYPGISSNQAPFVLRQEGGGIWQSIGQLFGYPPPPVVAPAEEPDAVVEPGEETTPSSAAPDKPEKVVDEMMIAVEQKNPAALEDLGEDGGGDEPEYGDAVERETGFNDVPQPTTTPADAVAPPRKFVAVHEPQFFGNFDLLQRGHQAGQTDAFVFRNRAQPFPQFAPPFPYSHHQTPLLRTASPQRGAYIPGQRHVDISHQVAPLEPARSSIPSQQDTSLQSSPAGVEAFQTSQPGLQTYQTSPSQPGLINVGPGYQNVYFITSRHKPDDSQAITVDANKMKKEEVGSDNSTVEEEQAGPSVAQAKPQAIALAGPGGVAAATPVATAVVGPGGLAVSAPTATAVAGPTGGGLLTGPAAAAVNKYLGGKKQMDDSHGMVAYTL